MDPSPPIAHAHHASTALASASPARARSVLHASRGSRNGLDLLAGRTSTTYFPDICDIDICCSELGYSLLQPTPVADSHSHLPPAAASHTKRKEMPYTPGNPQRGSDLFTELCVHCHTIEAGAPHPYGPNLSGIWGQRAGTIPSYVYSPANAAAGTGKRPITWDEQTMYEYLRAPKKYIPGTKKPFEGVPNEQDRCALVAYLKQATTPPKEPEKPRNVCFIQ
ncbi:unnamed protein product [Peniophora sp. CBMAI 1063]|nr:unnamed protein product [Peniophora sp. CBMAI 1063]